MEYIQEALVVPRTMQYKHDLGPQIDNVKWASTDNLNGVAIVTGNDCFLGTTVRIGNKTYTGHNDGLTLKSNTELELSVPLTAAGNGVVLSGRYQPPHSPIEGHRYSWHYRNHRRTGSNFTSKTVSCRAESCR